MDPRNVAEGRPFPLKVVVRHHDVRAYINLNISLFPEQWDSVRQRIVSGTRRVQTQVLIQEKKSEIDRVAYQLDAAGAFVGLRSLGIRKLIEAELAPKPEESSRPRGVLFAPKMESFIALKSPGTKRVYTSTVNRMKAYLGIRGYQNLLFGDIDVKWLRGFDTFLAKTAPNVNARNIHFRNIRAVFNDALADEEITHYPFRRFKLRYEKTRKRALTVEQLRQLCTMEVEPWLERYRDCFILILLFRGINIIDLCHLKTASGGVVEYIRAKTHKPYSIKVEPEAQRILDKYRGKKWLLNYMDGRKSYRDYYQTLSKALRCLGDRIGVTGLSTYWARHTWATLASYLDIPFTTIAAGLGHGGNTVTDIYIDYDYSKVDRANRQIIDWAFYGKM